MDNNILTEYIQILKYSMKTWWLTRTDIVCFATNPVLTCFILLSLFLIFCDELGSMHNSTGKRDNLKFQSDFIDNRVGKKGET
jgi:hypothetical protein